MISKRDPQNEKEINELEIKLNKGLFGWVRNTSIMNALITLFSKDKGAFLERRRLLSLYSTLWGVRKWNDVTSQNMQIKNKEVIESADKHIK